MNQPEIKTPPIETPIKILLADDDVDDRYFFNKVLKSLPFITELSTVKDGEKLMGYIYENSESLPDVLFLDLNMPKKNGSECLVEIKQDERLEHLPVIIYSTHRHEKDSDMLYEKGAHYYIRKTDMIELTKSLRFILDLIATNNFKRPARDKFSLSVDSLVFS